MWILVITQTRMCLQSASSCWTKMLLWNIFLNKWCIFGTTQMMKISWIAIIVLNFCCVWTKIINANKFSKFLVQNFRQLVLDLHRKTRLCNEKGIRRHVSLCGTTKLISSVLVYDSFESPFGMITWLFEIVCSSLNKDDGAGCDVQCGQKTRLARRILFLQTSRDSHVPKERLNHEVYY